MRRGTAPAALPPCIASLEAARRTPMDTLGFRVEDIFRWVVTLIGAL